MKMMKLALPLIGLFFLVSCANSADRKNDVYIDQSMNDTFASSKAPEAIPYSPQAGFDQDPSGN